MEHPVAFLLALLVVTAPLQGCLSGDLPFTGGDEADDGGSDGGDDGTDDQDDGGGSDDGGDEDPPGPLPNATFNGTRAYRWIERQVHWDNGTTQYRIPGTRGSEEVRREIVSGLDDYGWQSTVQPWNEHYVCQETRLVNIIGTLPGRSSQQIILGAHYDTRPWADQDENFSKKSRPVVGANDGGSGVAALLELARVLGDRDLHYTVKLVFFDAEDGGITDQSFAEWHTGCNPDEDENHTTPGGWVIGSSHYVATMGPDERSRTDGVIILDMVADDNLTLLREVYSSQEGSPDHKSLQDRIWSTAAELNYTQFVNETGQRILDDHRPFQREGMRAVDVIHQDRNGTVFPDTWHTTNDTLEHVSAESLEAVGRVTERTLYALDAELARS